MCRCTPCPLDGPCPTARASTASGPPSSRTSEPTGARHLQRPPHRPNPRHPAPHHRNPPTLPRRTGMPQPARHRSLALLNRHSSRRPLPLHQRRTGQLRPLSPTVPTRCARSSRLSGVADTTSKPSSSRQLKHGPVWSNGGHSLIPCAVIVVDGAGLSSGSSLLRSRHAGVPSGWSSTTTGNSTTLSSPSSCSIPTPPHGRAAPATPTHS
jgi:hypothetical protein